MIPLVLTALAVPPPTACDAPTELHPVLLQHGLKPNIPAGAATIDPDTWGSTDQYKLWQAGEYAAANDAVVVMNRIYEVGAGVRLIEGVTYTGGGIKRACNGLTFDLVLNYPNNYQDGIVIDSVLFDGNNRNCPPLDPHWTEAATGNIRGHNIVRNSVFYDMPSENLTVCGATLEDNQAYDLQGSFAHKSCNTASDFWDTISANIVHRSNLAGDVELEHSEGLITLSANAGRIVASNNVFTCGNEAVWGTINSDRRGITTFADTYAYFPGLQAGNTDPETEHYFRMKETTLIDVGP